MRSYMSSWIYDLPLLVHRQQAFSMTMMYGVHSGRCFLTCRCQRNIEQQCATTGLAVLMFCWLADTMISCPFHIFHLKQISGIKVWYGLAGNSENQVRYINHRWSCLAVQDIVIAILAAIDNSLSCILDQRKIPEAVDQYFQRPIRDLKEKQAKLGKLR